MAAVDEHLIEAIEDAMLKAASEAETAALRAAISRDELPSNPEVLLGAVFEAAEYLKDFWDNLPDGLGALLHTGDRDKFEEARRNVKHTTRAANALIKRLLAEIDDEKEGA
jgi:hypothetical protein